MLAGEERMVPAGSFMPVLSENAASGAVVEEPSLDVAGTVTRPPLPEHSGLLPTSPPDSQALWDNSSLDALEDSILQSGQKVLSLLHQNEATTAQGNLTISHTVLRKELVTWVGQGPIWNFINTKFL